MDHISPNSKNVLMELESLKSKECIFKMKELNYIKDKEILEDSIKTLQKDVQEKCEIIRNLRKEIDGQSSDLYMDITIKSEELEKFACENNDLTKKLTIALETIDHHVKRNETLRSEFDKQKNNYNQESDCKSRLVAFFEASSSQKDAKILALISDVNSLKSTLFDVQEQSGKQVESNDDLRKNIAEMKQSFNEYRQEREQDLQRAKNEIIQLQQNGISELHLEKMNPTAAATIKALKSSKGLMDIYSELHKVMGERDHLQLENNRIVKSNEKFVACLKDKEVEIERFSTESIETTKITLTMKSRLLGLVAELRTSETKKGKIEREMLLAKRKLEKSEQEVLRLMEQVRVLLVAGGIGENIKQEPVDVDSAMYTSVQELQEINRVMRNDNDMLRTRLDESDSEQFKQRCNELKLYSESLRNEVEHLKHENTSFKNLLNIHEKQVQMLRYLVELKAPGSTISIDKALRSLEDGIKGSVEIAGECETVGEERSTESVHEVVEESNRILKLENDIFEILENKRASDQVYVQSIEIMRSDFIKKNRLSIDLIGKLEELTERFKEEREMNERYRKESELLRAINKNLSQNTSVLEAQTDDFKLKLECKISQLAEKKAELDNCKTQLLFSRSQQIRMNNEREELKKTLENQQDILTNISSVQNMANLKDHLCLSNMQFKVQELEKSVNDLRDELTEKNEELLIVHAQLEESKALEAAYNESLSVADTCDAECQVALLTVNEDETREPPEPVVTLVNNEILISEYMAAIKGLEDKLKDMQSVHQHNMDQLEVCADNMTDLNQKCDFYENQLNILEKAKQEALNENIKLTEEAHDLNACLRQDLHKHQEELCRMKVRLEEAENVERTAQSVIDKYVKECNEAKAKYKRELTLHATDSKLLNALNKEIENLKSLEKDDEEKYRRLNNELTFCEEKKEQQLSDMRAQIAELEQRLRETESRRDRLYNQLQQTSGENTSATLNEIIEDLRGQISVGKLSSNLSQVEREKYENELERLRSEVADLQDQLSLEKDKSSLNISEGDSAVNFDVEIVKESNHVLREQKSQLDRLVLSQRFEIDDLSQLVSRLETKVAALEVQNGALVLLKGELEEERNRWKERCTKLIERAEQLDPEKYRVACNDRDRFEKQLVERESNFKEMQAEFLNAKEEINNLSAAVEEERNKLKKEEAIGIQLKDIARKYKGESEKRRLTILNLEKETAKLTNDKTELIQEKLEAILRLEETEASIESRTKVVTDEKQEVLSKLLDVESEMELRSKTLIEEKEEVATRLGLIESELQSRTDLFMKEKENLISRLRNIESEYVSLTEVSEELSSRCQLLEQMEKEKSMKLQLTESTIMRLNEDNNSMKRRQEESKSIMKRSHEEMADTEPESKKSKMTMEESSEESDRSEEELCVEEESVDSEDSAINDEGAGDRYQENRSVASTDIKTDATKIWWNVSQSADEDLIKQVQMNLAQDQDDVASYEDSDVPMQGQDLDSQSYQESLVGVVNRHFMEQRSGSNQLAAVNREEKEVEEGEVEDEEVEDGDDSENNPNYEQVSEFYPNEDRGYYQHEGKLADGNEATQKGTEYDQEVAEAEEYYHEVEEAVKYLHEEEGGKDNEEEVEEGYHNEMEEEGEYEHEDEQEDDKFGAEVRPTESEHMDTISYDNEADYEFMTNEEYKSTSMEMERTAEEACYDNESDSGQEDSEVEHANEPCKEEREGSDGGVSSDSSVVVIEDDSSDECASGHLAVFAATSGDDRERRNEGAREEVVPVAHPPTKLQDTPTCVPDPETTTANYGSWRGRARKLRRRDAN